MKNSLKSDQLIVPVYINEKIVLDMLAIIEDGFSTVSQINYTESGERNSAQRGEAGISTSATILSKLLKINVSGEVSHSSNRTEQENIVKEKVHTNVSLLSKFRSCLIEHQILRTDFDVSKIKLGDFIEIDGELQKKSANKLHGYIYGSFPYGRHLF